jgi:hypothetical protein
MVWGEGQETPQKDYSHRLWKRRYDYRAMVKLKYWGDLSQQQASTNE